MKSPAPARAFRASPLAYRLAALIAGLSSVSHAAEIFKSNNADAMNSTTSWEGGVIPGANDIAVFDSRIAAATLVVANENQSFSGLRVVNNAPGLFIDSFFSGGGAIVLSLGAAGLDFSAATAGNTFTFDSPTLNLTQTQTWSVADGAVVTLEGPLTRALGSTLNFNLGAIGTGRFRANTFGTPSAILPYATVDGRDFAALNASRDVVPGATLGTYVPNPNSGASNPDLVGTFGTMDVVNSNTGGINAVRVSGSAGLTTAGIRFNTPHATGANWVVDIPGGRNYNLGNNSVVVSPALGTQTVSFNGGGNIRLASGSQFTLHQYNTTGDLILNAQMNQPDSGGGAVVIKSGPGRAIFTSNGNSYRGGTVVSQGTLQVGNGGASGVLGGGDITNNGSLVFNRSDIWTVINNITGSGQVTKTGSGELNFTTNVSTYTGATNVDGGTLSFTSLPNLGAGNAINFNGGALRWAPGNTADISVRTITLGAGGGTLNTNGNDVALANALGNGGAGGLTKTGAGRLVLNAPSTYQGTTSVNGGVLVAASASGSATGAGAVAVNSGGTLAGTGNAGGAVTVNTGGKIAPGDSSVGTLTVGSLNLQNGALLDLEFSATPSNDRVVVANAGGLSIAGGAINVLTAGSSAGWTTPGTYQIFQYNGAIQGSGTSSLSVLNPQPGYGYSFGSAGGFVTLSINQLGMITNWTQSGSGSFATPGNWSNGVPTGNGATANFTTSLSGAATVTLDGTRNLAGLAFDSANSYTLAAGTNGLLVLDNGISSASVNIVSGSHLISAPTSLVSDLSVSAASGSSLTVSGGIIGSGDLTKSGPGTLALTGNNQIVGTTLVAGGVVEFGQSPSLGNGAISLNGGTLRYGSGNNADLSSRVLEIGVNGGTIDTNGNNVTFAQPFGNSGAGVFTKSGEGTLTLADGNTYAGITRIEGGVLRIGSDLGPNAAGVGISLEGGALGTSATFTTDRVITVGAAGGRIDTAINTTFTVNPALNGAGSLAKSGGGTLVLSSASTRTTPTSLNAGTLVLANSTAAGNGAITMANGTTLNVAANAATFTLNPVTITNGSTVTFLSSNITGGFSGNNITGAADTRLVVGGTTQVNFGAAATQQLAGMLGTVEIAEGATARFSATNLNNGGAGTSFELAGTITARNNGTVQLGKLSGLGNIFGSNGADNNTSIFAIGGRNENSTYGGVIADSNVAVGRRAALTKNGTATLSLTGAHTYSGPTLVNDGTLRVLGSLGATTTTVALNGTTLVAGTLAGNGTLSGPVTVNGVLRPDASGTLGGQLTLTGSAALTLSPSAVTQFDFAGTAFTGVSSAVSGGVTYGGSLNLNYLGSIFNGSYTLFSLTGAPNGAFTSVNATSAATNQPVALTDNSGIWTGSIDGATLSFNSATGVLTVTGGATVVGLPAIPGAVGATPGDGSVSLAWNAAANAANYLVKRATTPGGPYTTLTSAVVTTSYVDTAVANDTTYYYVIQAQNQVGFGGNSAEVSATPTAVTLSALEQWRTANLSGVPEALRGDAADPDNDGIANLLEYATGRSPTVADTTPVLAVAKSGDGLRLTVSYNRIADANLVYTVQGTNSLATNPIIWTTVATSTGGANVAGPVTVTDTALISATALRFLRLEVGYTTP